MATRNGLVAGWYLIDGQLPAEEGDLAVWVLAEGTELRVPLPVTLKGRIYELVSIPAGARRLSVVAEAAGRDVDPLQLTVRRVTSAGARLLMWDRIAGVLPKMPPAQRRVLGLSWPAALLEPKRSYRQVGKLRAYFPAPCYEEWIQRFEEVTPRQRRQLRARLKRGNAAGLRFRVLIDGRGLEDPAAVRRAVESVREQWDLQASVRLLIEDPVPPRAMAEIGVSGLEAITASELVREPADAGSWTLFMPASTILAPWALAWFACEALRRPAVALMYSDHDHLSADGERQDPKFKPDFSLELARSSAYLGSVLALREDKLREVLGSLDLGTAYGLALEFARLCGDEVIHHVPAILWHQVGADAVPDKASLEQHLRRCSVAAEALPDRGTHLRVRYSLPAVSPMVSILVPTRDMLHFLKPCVESLLARTTWPNYEILIVDNQSTCAETLAFMDAVGADDRVRVLRYDRPFNFSAINNYAAEQARGDILCLLNNDTEVLTPEWLEEMVSRLLQPGIGVVGARLYFTDGRVQHAGDVLGPGGCASHLHGPIAADDPGYMDRAMLAQDLSAVTAACFVTPRELYRSLGGWRKRRCRLPSMMSITACVCGRVGIG
ncbi:glycosyltransferase family 2 protein [Marinobacterium aestuariivivens]